MTDTRPTGRRPAFFVSWAAALVATMLPAPPALAAVPTPLYAGGVTLSGPVYRNIFNSFSNSAGSELCVGVSNCPLTPYRGDVEILYLAVTSANTALAFDGYNPALFVMGNKVPVNPPVASTTDYGPFYGSGTGASWVPSGSATDYFPTISFTSGDPMAQTDVTNATALGFGPPIQVPSLSYSVVLPFRPTANWTPLNPPPKGASSGVDLPTDVLCGIYTGAITDWSSPEFKPANKKQQLGNGPITVVYRHDGAATTLLLANALLNQCGTTSNPISTHPVPDQWLADNAIANTPPYHAGTSFFINVFNKNHLPANFYDNAGFAGVTGGVVTITGMQEAIDATPGAIGYLSSDYAPPVATGADPLGNTISSAVNVQSWASYSHHSTPVYIPPTATSSALIMSSQKTPSFVGGASAPALNPLSWSSFNPTPANDGAYPIGGFAYFELYSCYGNATELDALAGTRKGQLGLIRWYLGSQNENGGIPAAILNNEGFAPPPPGWRLAALQLIWGNATTKIGRPLQRGTACAKIGKGA